MLIIFVWDWNPRSAQPPVKACSEAQMGILFSLSSMSDVHLITFFHVVDFVFVQWSL